MSVSTLSPNEKLVVEHFKQSYHRSDTGRFVVPLPKKPQAKLIGESRTQAVCRFITRAISTLKKINSRKSLT